MEEMKALAEKIEEMRVWLRNKVAEKKGDFLDPEVAGLSQQLDKLIVAYEKMKMKNKIRS